MSTSNESSTELDDKIVIHTEPRHIPIRFWNVYEAEGAKVAMLYLATEFEFNDSEVKEMLPIILAEGVENRGISIPQFYQEFLDAVGAINDGGGISSDSSSEDVRDAHEDAASEARDADVEDQGGAEECTKSEDLSQ
jgi:hypothetical protein